MPPPPLWRYRCYRTAGGVDVIREWYEGETEQWQVKFVRLLQSLQSSPRPDWKYPRFRWLGDGIGEIRFKANRVQQRPLGFQGPRGADVFTIVFAATERGDRFVPRDAIARAIARKAEVERDAPRYSISCWLFDDPNAPNP
jgi:hypothetical protein